MKSNCVSFCTLKLVFSHSFTFSETGLLLDVSVWVAGERSQAKQQMVAIATWVYTSYQAFPLSETPFLWQVGDARAREQTLRSVYSMNAAHTCANSEGDRFFKSAEVSFKERFSLLITSFSFLCDKKKVPLLICVILLFYVSLSKGNKKKKKSLDSIKWFKSFRGAITSIASI